MVNVRSFNGSSSITLAPGGLAGLTFGTVAAVVRRADNAGWHGIFAARSSGGTPETYLDSAPSTHGTDRAIWCSYNGTTNSGATKWSAADSWCLIAVTKATGSATPRFHKYVYSTGVWTHTNGAAALPNATSPSSSGSLVLGNVAGDALVGDLAAVAVWMTALSDAAVEALAPNWPAWLAAAPQAAWLLNQASTGTSVPDATGGGATQTALTGTTVSSATIPGWSETAGSSVNIGQATETSTATAVGRAKSLGIGRATETSTARPVTAGTPTSQSVNVGRATDTATARPVARVKAAALGRATATDTARGLTLREALTLGRAVELDTARPVTPTKARQLGRAAELVTAGAIAGRAKSLTLGRAVETSSARPLVLPALVVIPGRHVAGARPPGLTATGRTSTLEASAR